MYIYMYIASPAVCAAAAVVCVCFFRCNIGGLRDGRVEFVKNKCGRPLQRRMRNKAHVSSSLSCWNRRRNFSSLGSHALGIFNICVFSTPFIFFVPSPFLGIFLFLLFRRAKEGGVEDYKYREAIPGHLAPSIPGRRVDVLTHAIRFRSAARAIIALRHIGSTGHLYGRGKK